MGYNMYAEQAFILFSDKGLKTVRDIKKAVIEEISKEPTATFIEKKWFDFVVDGLEVFIYCSFLDEDGMFTFKNINQQLNVDYYLFCVASSNGSVNGWFLTPGLLRKLLKENCNCLVNTETFLYRSGAMGFRYLF